MAKKIDNVNQVAGGADLLEALQAVMHAARARHHQALRDAGLGLTPLEARLLGFFARRPGAMLTELAEHAGRDKGQLARLVQALRERGLLQAEADARDGRVTRLSLSPEAKAMHDTLQRQRRREAEAAAAGLSAAEREALIGLLARLRANLER
jgi:DNA-binding MarR family transcriptional regulator